MALGLILVSSSAAHATAIQRMSDNGCGTVVLYYDYYSQGGGRYHISVTNVNHWWDSMSSTCGILGRPYGLVLQWKGKHNGSAFGPEAFPNGYVDSDSDVITDFSGGGYADVRFRVCNWNRNTGYVGTCGNW